MPGSGPGPALVLLAAPHRLKRDRWIELGGRAGHRVLEAFDGVHALAMTTRHLPDLVIAEVVLPKLDGLQLASRIASNLDMRDIPIILVRHSQSRLGSSDTARPIVCDADAVPRHVQQLLASRTSLVEGRRRLRRALADIRASVQEGCEESASLRDRARHMASGPDETMISVLVADDSAHFIEANPAICALTGYSRAQLLKMSIWDLSADEIVERGQRAWRRFLRDGRFEGNYRIRRSSGEHVTIRCSSAANVAPGLHVSTMAPATLLHVLRS